MKSHIKTYQIVLETLGPVFIGSGMSLGKKETIFDLVEKKVYVPNMHIMYQWLLKRKLGKSYEEFMLGNYSDFGMWLSKNKVKKSEYLSWIAYELDATDADLEVREKKEIMCFVKDAYQMPYIPGSSLKGALRTILIGNHLIENQSKFANVAYSVKKAQFQKRTNYLVRESKQVEHSILRKRNLEETKWDDALNDELAGIRISDSKPLACKDLTLCKKVDIAPNGVENKINILRECIKPGTRVYFDLSIDETVTQLTPTEILNAIENFLQYYNQVFDNRFKTGDNYTGSVLYLGGGSGFVSKTVLYPLLGRNAVGDVSRIIDATLPSKMKREHNHSGDASAGVSPHMIKKTIMHNKRVSFGPCKIEIKEI